MGLVSSPYADLDRPPLPAAALRSALEKDAGLWRELRLVAETASTNADVAAAAKAGTPEGLVVVAEHQSAGRGRLDRTWSSPPRAGLTLSVLLRPAVPRERWQLLPLLAGVAAVGAIRAQTEVAVALKWPNDVVVGDRGGAANSGGGGERANSGGGGERKLAGLLAEVVGDAVVVGMGINVSTRPDELPPGATSLAAEAGRTVDRAPLLIAVLREVATGYDGWVSAGGAPEAVLAAYGECSATLGREVRATLPAGGTLTGRAVEVDGAGRLVVELPGGERKPLAAAEVVHLRGQRTRKALSSRKVIDPSLADDAQARTT